MTAGGRGRSGGSAGPGSRANAGTPGPGIDLRPEDPDETGRHWLLIRRNDTTGEGGCWALPPLLQAPPTPARTLAGAGRGSPGATLGACEEVLHSRQGPSSGARPTGIRTWILLAPLDRPGHARRDLPHRDHRVRNGVSETRPRRSDPPQRQRVPSPLCRSLTTTTIPQPNSGLAVPRWRPTTQAPRIPNQPLPTTRTPIDHELRLVLVGECRASAWARESSIGCRYFAMGDRPRTGNPDGTAVHPPRMNRESRHCRLPVAFCETFKSNVCSDLAGVFRFTGCRRTAWQLHGAEEDRSIAWKVTIAMSGYVAWIRLMTAFRSPPLGGAFTDGVAASRVIFHAFPTPRTLAGTCDQRLDAAVDRERHGRDHGEK